MIEVVIKDKTYIFEETFNWDVIEQGNEFHIVEKNKSYRCVLLKREEKSMQILVNGNTYTLELKDKYDLLLDKLGMSNLNSKKINNIKAPMPGLVMDIKVNEGDLVSEGGIVLVLEAMKMENMIKSAGEGVVKSILIAEGDAVEKNQILIEFE